MIQLASKRTWESVKEVMAPGTIDALTKEMIYLAVSVTNGCGYCNRKPRLGRPQGRHDRSHVGELMGVVGMANETNRLGQRLPGADRPAFE